VGAGSAAPDACGEQSPGVEVVVDEAARAEEFARRAAPVVGKLTRALVGMVAPTWTVTSHQHDELAQSVSYAMALWFPAEIPPKYAALMMVGMSVYGIVDANRDEKGELRPRVKPRTDGTTTAA
jgi:hypothetical protein